MDALNNHDACIVLNAIGGIGPTRYKILVQTFGSPEFVLNACSAGDLSRINGISAALADKLVHWEQHVDLENELSLVERAGAHVITRTDADYPECLTQIPDPPICLYVRGKLPPDLNERSLSVVGTRRMSRYGRDMAQFLTEAAILSDWRIISGMAAGIDAAAHEAALKVGSSSIGVLGGGLGRMYPQEHVPLARQTVEAGGAVISEFPMMMPPNRRTFPMRNRIVAALGCATLVVEANLGSGAMITANLALDYNRHVFAVPGPVDSPLSRGCHALIKQGAKLVETFEDIAEEFDFLPQFLNVLDRCSPDESEGPAPLSNDAQHVLGYLRENRKATLEDLVSALDQETGSLLSTLMQLEMKRKIKPLPGGFYAIIPNA